MDRAPNGGYPCLVGCVQEAKVETRGAWDTRGELDAVRIELETRSGRGDCRAPSGQHRDQRGLGRPPDRCAFPIAGMEVEAVTKPVFAQHLRARGLECRTGVPGAGRQVISREPANRAQQRERQLLSRAGQYLVLVQAVGDQGQANTTIAHVHEGPHRIGRQLQLG